MISPREGASAEYCRRRLRECDVYVATVGFRYGTKVPGEAVSYTGLEFGEATAVGLPRLVFLLSEDADVPAALTDVDRAAVDGFRRRLRDAGVLIREFSSDAGLELEVSTRCRTWPTASYAGSHWRQA